MGVGRTVLTLALTVAVIAALVGGASMAWFTDAATPATAEFTAGTVLIEPDEAVPVSGDIEDLKPGECVDLKYEVKNEGSKCIFLRAALEGRWYIDDTDTAMVRMNDDPKDFSYPWESPPGLHAWFTYIIYDPYDPDNGQDRFYFYAGQHHRAGEVYVSKQGGKLVIEINLDDNVKMGESHVKVETSAEALFSGPGHGHAFGQWPYKGGAVASGGSYTYEIPWKGAWDGKELFIGVHGGDVSGPFSGESEWEDWDPTQTMLTIEPCDDNWKFGDDGYLYYVGDGECLEGIAAGEEVELCLRVCLDGDVDDRYKNAEFYLTVTFEAIQCSNQAADYQGWKFACSDS